MSNDQPTLEVLADGSQMWCLNGKFHCTDGPAVEWADGTMEWWVNGERHRTDGPAVMSDDGTTEFWENGKRIS